MKAFALALRLAGGGVLLIATATAAPINTDTALPIYRGEFLWREQWRFMRASSGAAVMRVNAVPSVLAYGFTEKFALIGMTAYVDKRLEMAGLERGSAGFGDTTLLGRYQLFQSDQAGETLRVQALAGIKFPTGRHDASDAMGRLPQMLQPGSGSTDGIAGAVFTWQRLDWQADFDVSYKHNTGADNYRFGDTLMHDAAFEYRLSPRRLSESGVSSFVYGVVELNGVWARHDVMSGHALSATGGYTLFAAPGLQYVTRRSVVEVSVQLPVIQNLNGIQPQTDYVFNAGFRFQF